jgi:hypothetical protein
MRRPAWKGLLLAAVGICVPRLATAATYCYVDWLTADVPHGTATGTITLPDQSIVGVTFSAVTAENGPGELYGAQVDGTGINYWIPSKPYVSAEVENPPPGTDLLQLAGGMNETYTVTFTEAIKDPVMAIASLGQPKITMTYDFNAPFRIVSQGVGYWSGSDTALVQLPGDVLQGTEGSGTIQFIGTFSTFSWTVPTPEIWHGFTFAIRTTERMEPGDGGDLGGATGGGSGLTGSDGGVTGAAGTNGGATGAAGTTGGDDPSGAGGDDPSGAGGETGAGGAGGPGAPETYVASKGGCYCDAGRPTHAATLGSLLMVAGAISLGRRRRGPGRD